MSYVGDKTLARGHTSHIIHIQLPPRSGWCWFAKKYQDANVRENRSLEFKNETSRRYFLSYLTVSEPSEMSNTAVLRRFNFQSRGSRRAAWHSAREQQRLLLARPIWEGIQIKVKVSRVHCSYWFRAPYFIVSYFVPMEWNYRYSELYGWMRFLRRPRDSKWNIAIVIGAFE